MFIAFEGPDNTGKSTTAASLTSFDSPIYNATKENHRRAQVALGDEATLVQTFDRIDWFSHMVYRLALPDRDWNDDRPRTVFAMPDTHLVLFTHHPQLAEFTADEVVDTPIGKVNPMYYYFGDYFMKLNKQMGFTLFKSVTMIEVVNAPENDVYLWKPYSFSSPIGDIVDNIDMVTQVTDPESLLEFLRYVEHVS